MDIADASLLMPAVNLTVNSQRSARYKVMPLEAFTGLRARTPIRTVYITYGDIRDIDVCELTDEVWASATNELVALRTGLDDMHRQLAKHKAAERLKSRTAAAKAASRRGRQPRMPRLDIGDFVLVALPERRRHKLEFNWQGPFVIMAPRMSDLPVRSCQGVPHIDESSHVFTVHLLGDKTHVEINDRSNKSVAM